MKKFSGFSGIILLSVQNRVHIALAITGVDWWTSINLGMTAIATGGFSVSQHSAAHLSRAAQAILMVAMILGAFSFGTHYQILRMKKIRNLFRDGQRILFFFLLLAGPVVVGWQHWHEMNGSWFESTFQWVSALTTCGLSNAGVATWGEGTKFLLIAAMFIGGMAGSTVGGIKIGRLYAVLKSIGWHFSRIWLPPRQLLRFKIHGKNLTENQARSYLESVAISFFRSIPEKRDLSIICLIPYRH